MGLGSSSSSSRTGSTKNSDGNDDGILSHKNPCFHCRPNIAITNFLLSHNNPCFQCNTAITNFLASNTCEIRFHDVMMYVKAHIYVFLRKNSKTWLTYMAK